MIDKAVAGQAEKPKKTFQAAAKEKLSPKPYSGLDPTQIPRRRFLCGPAFQEHHLTVTIAPPGVGKTSLSVAEAAFMACGRNLFGGPLPAPLRVWLFNGEETRDEMERRIAAVILAHGLNGELVKQNLFCNSGREDKIMLMDADDREPNKGGVDELTAAIKDNGVNVLIVDPFVSTHSVTENDNTAIDKVAGAWSRIASNANCAIHLVHHTRKTGGEEITAESGRGASALVASARYVRALSRLKEREASELGLDDTENLVRIEVVKENNSHSSGPDAFRIFSQNLGNGDGDDPGDSIGVIRPIDQLGASRAPLTPLQIMRAQLQLSQGNHKYNESATGWAGIALASIFGLDPSKKAAVQSRINEAVKAQYFVLAPKKLPGDKKEYTYLEVGKPITQAAA